ncbi:MAG: hypothetical protein HKN68_00385 [Saprospiraceae bacterium]|nr:hypothetical protein [Saprospiraceae bacterium]
MINFLRELQNLVLFFSIMLCSITLFSQTTMYWVGGSGDWDDPNQIHWSKQSGTLVPTGALPDDNSNVIFDNGSGLTAGTSVTIPSGDWQVNDFLVQTSGNFDLIFDGSSGNMAAMNVYGDLTLQPTHDLIYNDPSIFHNVWRFDGNRQHNIITGNQDLSSVEFLNAGTTYNQLSDLKATERIRMYGGTWNTNGYNVNSGILLFQDNNGSGSPLAKVFNASTSDITCDQWYSRLAYQSLTVTGDYKIYTKQFLGSPGTSSQSFLFNDIYLEDFVDDAPAGISQIEHNNFECTYCEVENLIIRDVSRTQLAGIFTITGELEVVNFGTTILFNGGNNREDEIIINGTVKTPKVLNCDDIRPIFSNVYNDFTTLTRNSGSLKIDDSEINNIQAQGGATFTAVNSVLQGSSSGWIESNPPVPLAYEWVGTTGTLSDWNDPSKWQLLGGSFNNCIPTIVDDVYITNEAKGGIRIPSPYKAFCRNLIWTNTMSLELVLDGQTILESELLIAGDFYLDETATITSINNHELIFSSASTNSIETRGVLLPDIYFVGDAGRWELVTDLECDQIIVEGGTIETQNQDITTDSWLSIEGNPKHYILGSSTITVNGEMKLAQLPQNNVTVDKGTSHIKCEKLTSVVPELYNVEMINTNAVLMDNWPVEFNKLILSGAGSVGTAQDMTLNDLVFNVDDTELQLNTGFDFKINGGIQSFADKTMPGILKSNTPGTRAEIDKDIGNICVEGYLNFVDIEAVLTGTMHAPFGDDIDGSNLGITFDGGSTSPDLFWIGGTDNNWNTINNWSRVTGGCPSTKNPTTSPNLVFDGNSFTDPTNTINLSASTTVANNVFFYNTEPLTIDIPNNFMPTSINIVGGDARFEGHTMEVQGNTHIESGGVLITEMDNIFRTFSFSGPSGIWIVRSGSSATIIDP